MLTFKGTHGTTKSRAEQILESGFKISDSGRAGRGVYFWQYFENPKIATNLAVGWFESQVKRGAYKEPSPECAVLDSRIFTDEDDSLDCTGEVLERVAIMLEKISDRTEDDISRAYDYVISKLEDMLGRPILVARAMVSPPKMSFAIKQLVPYPPILVVRDQSVKIESKLVINEEV